MVIFSNGQSITIKVPAAELKAPDGNQDELAGLTLWLQKFRNQEFHVHRDAVWCTNQVVAATFARTPFDKHHDDSGQA